MQVQTYQEAGRELLAQGFAELEQGDSRQASEKGWGAAAQMLKAVAERRDLEHKRHAALGAMARQLGDENGDQDIRRLFQVASDLHTNFYENLYDVHFVKAGLEDVRLFLDKLEPLLNMARYYANPDTHMVHREDGCSDVRLYKDRWVFIGFFPSRAEAAAADRADCNPDAPSCQNCDQAKGNGQSPA